MRKHLLATLACLALLHLNQGQAQAAPLLGYGAKTCEEFLATWRGWDKNQAKEVADMYRYEDWLAGFVSGLNFMTRDDQLLGLGVDSVLRRNQIYCDEHPKDDFVTATMAFIKSLKEDQ